MVVGRGPFIDSFPLFGFKLEDYDSCFCREARPAPKDPRERARPLVWQTSGGVTGQGVYPRPVQNPFSIWLGVGGTPQSFARAGALGLPLMVAIIGGETRRFRPLLISTGKPASGSVTRPID
jgi:alkanesulfonate monooxygenase SsuD/methylene tetrahydromethanopterin reductase-like flavin-dependent oxidoreductase (luciferase family)